MAPRLLLSGPVNPQARVRRRRSGGFTLIELLVVLLVLGIAMGLGIPALHNFIIRSKTEGYTRDVGVLLQQARLEAIRMNRPAAVYLDPASGEIRAFLDADKNLEYAPDGAEVFRATDYELGRLPLPSGVEFRDEAGTPGAGSVDGITTVAVDGSDLPAAIFRPDGSVLDQMPDDAAIQTAFAFRIADLRGNHLEVRISPLLTGKVEVRKYRDADNVWAAAGDPSDPDYQPWGWK